MVHGMVMVHDITSTVHQVGCLIALQNRITCQLHQLNQLHVNYTSGHEKYKKPVSVMRFNVVNPLLHHIINN